MESRYEVKKHNHHTNLVYTPKRQSGLGTYHAGTVDEALLEEVLHDGGRAPDLLHVLHHVLAARLEVGDERHAVAALLHSHNRPHKKESEGDVR